MKKPNTPEQRIEILGAFFSKNNALHNIDECKIELKRLREHRDNVDSRIEQYEQRLAAFEAALPKFKDDNPE